MSLWVDEGTPPSPHWSPYVGIGAHMSDPTAISRRLVAVFAADVEGYSRLLRELLIGLMTRLMLDHVQTAMLPAKVVGGGDEH